MLQVQTLAFKEKNVSMTFKLLNSTRKFSSYDTTNYLETEYCAFYIVRINYINLSEKCSFLVSCLVFFTDAHLCVIMLAIIRIIVHGQDIFLWIINSIMSCYLLLLQKVRSGYLLLHVKEINNERNGRINKYCRILSAQCSKIKQQRIFISTYKRFIYPPD